MTGTSVLNECDVTAAVIVGLGGLGRRHARNLKQLNPSIRLTGCRTRSTSVEDLGEDGDLFDRIEYGIDRALVSNPQFAVVASPASQHVNHALQLARAGVDLLIEKPLSDTFKGVQELVDECRQRAVKLAIGYNLRFEPSLQAVKRAVDEKLIGRVLAIRAEVGQYLPDWRPGRDYRQTVSAQAALGGGPLLELSHEFDYVRWLVGDVRTVVANVGRVGDLDIDVPDVADVLLDIESGALGTVHLDMLDRASIRRCRVVGTDGTVAWNALERSAKLFSHRSRTWVDLAVPVGSETDTYLAEMEHWLSFSGANDSPIARGEDGLKALKIALAAAESAATGRKVAL